MILRARQECKTAQRAVLALHEPERRPPARREPAAWSNDRAGPEAGAPITRFMVPMHAQERKETLHEPRAKAGASSTHSKRCRAVAERLGLREAFGVRPACRRFPQFMVPMHAQKRAVFLARFAFTLIELLVVIAIIAILAG